MAMKLCVSSCSFNGSILDTIKAAPKLGVKYLECAAPISNFPYEYHLVDFNKLNNMLAESNCTMPIWYTPCIYNADRKKMQETVDNIKDEIDFLEKKGINKIVFASYRKAPGGLELMGEGLKQLTDHVKGRDFTIFQENHHLCQVDTIEDIEYMLKVAGTDNLKINIDTGHFYLSGIDTVEFIKNYAGVIGHIHMKDHFGEDTVVLGTGEVDIPAIVKALEDIGYDGFVTMEQELSETPFEDALESTKYMRQFIKE